MADMLKRMGFEEEAEKIRKVWTALYNPGKGHRIPAYLLQSASETIPNVVDEMAFQTRRNLAQRALVDVIPFRREDEGMIRRGAKDLVRGIVPGDLPPRFMVSASRYAIEKGASLPELSRLVITHLSKSAASQVPLSALSRLKAA
jgi:hypothetical protein